MVIKAYSDSLLPEILCPVSLCFPSACLNSCFNFHTQRRGRQFPTENRESLPSEQNPLVRHLHTDDAPSCGGLKGRECTASQPCLPVRAEAAVRGTGDRIFVNT